MSASDTPAAPRAPNRLAREASPYLRQHAHNPVDWYPWGEEAFAKARQEGKPIFLSVGYSTCHWCHVMAHESFEDAGIARLLNRHFVPVKVDREERPDLDRLYMTYVQGVTRGGGGWPLSVWLTLELKPFYGGTYFPPEDRYGRPGFSRVLASLADAWRASRAQLEEAGEQTVVRLRAYAAGPGASAAPGEALFREAAEVYEAAYDPVHGGFGGAPKFPRPSSLFYLFRHHARTGSRRSLEMALHTLSAMADGGLHDHLGGGFHRYATDAAWLIPHFEKMLYDQALLACAYLEAHQLSGDPFFADVARDTLGYVRRDLTGEEGEFFSAEDADSPAEEAGGHPSEGAFYTWRADEVGAALDARDAAALGAAFGLDRVDNLVEGRHVLAVSNDGARELLAALRGPLLQARARRPRPSRDTKALAAWNGLMLSAFARAYQVLGDAADLRAAERAADFVRQRLCDAAGARLFRSRCAGEAKIAAYAEDYAYLIQGLLDLYEAGFNPARLEWALALQAQLDARFWDEAGGGYFSSEAGASDVLVRLKETADGAEPSANAVAVSNLARIGAITGGEAWRGRAEAAAAVCGPRLRDAPDSAPHMLAALDRLLGPSRQVVIAGRPGAPDTRALLRAAQRPFAPRQVVLLADGGAGQAYLARFQPAIGRMGPVAGRATAYVCEDFVCQEPVTDADELLQRLRRS